MKLPSTMRYIEAASAGGPEVLRLATEPVPVPGADDVLIRVQAAGVNRPDIMQRKGLYSPPAGASPHLGLEVAGEIVGLGKRVSGWQLGERVCALVNGGGYAEYCLSLARQCLPWPKGYTALQAAAVPENYFTVWANVFQLGRLGKGETLLVHGGSGGIGITAIQLAHALAGAVYATVGSQEKAAACLKLGADAAIDYHEQDFAQAVAELTHGRGVDVILDSIGAAYLPRNMASLRSGGRLISIAVMQGAKAEVNLADIMQRRLTLTGSTMRPRTTAEKSAIAQELFHHVWPLLETGRCAPVIHRVFPLAQAADAHRLMESRQHVGKIMLQVAD